MSATAGFSAVQLPGALGTFREQGLNARGMLGLPEGAPRCKQSLLGI
jgi:hypothetical protein